MRLILKRFRCLSFMVMILMVIKIDAFAQILVAKPMIEAHEGGLYDLITKLRGDRNEEYEKCIKNNNLCSGIFSTDILYSLEENGIGYYSEASFLSKLKNKKDIGIDDKEFYLLFSYGCRVMLKDNSVKKFVSIYFPHPNYYNYIKQYDKVKLTNDDGVFYFLFRKNNLNGSTFLFNDNRNEVDSILSLLRERKRIELSMADDVITSEMDYFIPKLEEGVFNRLCKIK